MKKKFNNTIRKITCVICAIGTYIMAFMAAGVFSGNIPLDLSAGAAVTLCNGAVLYLFIVSGFDLINGDENDLTIIHDNNTEITAEGFCEDYFDAFFTEDENNG